MIKETRTDPDGTEVTVIKNKVEYGINDEDFALMENPSYDAAKEKEELTGKLKVAYNNILAVLREYLDIEEKYYNLIALWIIGTYFHDKFPSYPFLFFNAMKGSGKTRAMTLITCLSKDGIMMNNPTEAVLFRTTGTLALDEYEGITRKGGEGLRELLNSCYKRGAVVRRMKQKKVDGATEQVVEEFPVYRPIVMANIWGMEEVLGDRCITLVLDKSNRDEVTNLIEIFAEEDDVIETKKLLEECSLCRCSFSGRLYKEWNKFVKNNYTILTNYTNNTNCINYNQLFKRVKSMDLKGRELELSLPLCMIANEIGSKNGVVLKETTLTLKEVFATKKEYEMSDNKDVNLIEFISKQEHNINFTPQIRLLNQFREDYGIIEEWVNHKWFGRALKRHNLIKEIKRSNQGMLVILDIERAKKKLGVFK